MSYYRANLRAAVSRHCADMPHEEDPRIPERARAFLATRAAYVANPTEETRVAMVHAASSLSSLTGQGLPMAKAIRAAGGSVDDTPLGPIRSDSAAVKLVELQARKGAA